MMALCHFHVQYISIDLSDYYYIDKMVREPNVSPRKQIIKDDDVKECSIVYHI